ncbi:hypothetical protein [Microbacterium sp. GXF0217]
MWHGLDRQNRQVVIWVRFPDGAVPDWCEEYTDAGTDHAVKPLTIGPRSVHVARFGFGPGVLGIRWGFDEDD